MLTREVAKLRVTKNYKEFERSLENRPVNAPKRRELRASMQKYGFIAAYPIHCVMQNGKKFVIDGQHRLAIAEDLGLPVYFVVDSCNVAPSEINPTCRIWKMGDYAGSFSQQGKDDYARLIEFSERHDLPISTAAMLLADRHADAGTSYSGALHYKFKHGEFKITNAAVAERVAKLYNAICQIGKGTKGRFLFNAISACFLVKGFDSERLLQGCRSYSKFLRKYGSREEYLKALEDAYNYRRQGKVALKFMAEQEVRLRNPAAKKA